jgi:hypothetical protein
VSITMTRRESDSHDAVLAELTQALEQIARAAPAPARSNEEVFKRKTGQRSEWPMLAAILERLSLPGTLQSWSLIGLLAVVCIGVIVFAWPSSDGPARADPGVQQLLVQAQTAAQGAGPTAAPIAPELTQWGQTIARELANLEQGIEQLKTSQAQLARDNADLADRLKETQEQIAQHDAELAEGLKAVQDEMVRNNLNTAEQLKANQDQIASIGGQLKARLQQMGRLGAPKQPVRQLASPSSPQPNATPTSKPAPKPRSPQAGPPPTSSTQSPSEQD